MPPFYGTSTQHWDISLCLEEHLFLTTKKVKIFMKLKVTKIVLNIMVTDVKDALSVILMNFCSDYFVASSFTLPCLKVLDKKV